MTQQAFAYLLSQAKHIERQVYRKKYPDIQYPQLVPVDRSASPWARGVTHFSSDMVGRPEPLAGRGNDFPLADIERQKYDVPIEMAGLGYDYTLEELGQAMMLNVNLTADKAMAVRRGVEEYIDDIVNEGRADLGWDSLKHPKGVRRIAASPGSVSGSAKFKRAWENKTAQEIIMDINAILMGVYAGHSSANNSGDTGSRTVEMADTLLLPPQIWVSVLTKTIPGTDRTVLSFIKENNVYTAKTNRPLMMREYRGLENAGFDGDTVAVGTNGANADRKPPSPDAGVGRIIAYRRDMDVLRLHMPMPLRFRRAWQSGPMRWIVPAIFRLGGLEIRLPHAMRVMDGIV